MMLMEHNIGHDHVQEVKERYEPLSPLVFCIVEVLYLPPKLEVLPYLHQVMEEAIVQYKLPQVQ